jgi:predicted metal-dependent hydrolase
MSEPPSATRDRPGELPPGRTPPLPSSEVNRLFREGVALFNGIRYWHAHEAWETVWRAAPDEERDFYQGLIQVAAGLLHLQRRNARGARNKLSEGADRLRGYQPSHQGVVVSDLVRRVDAFVSQLNDGVVPYLIPPLIRNVELEPDWSR